MCRVYCENSATSAKLPLVETIFRWLLEEDRKERPVCKNGLFTALSVVRWAQANKIGDREFAEAMIKQLVLSMNDLAKSLYRRICNDPGPSIVVSQCASCGRGPIEIKRDGG